MQISSYETLVEYVSPEDLACLDKGMASTPSLSEDLLRLMQSGNWESVLTRCDRSAFPLQALKLLKAGEITATQWSTSQLFFNVYPCHDKVSFIPLFPNGQRSRFASNMINATMKVAYSAIIAYRKSLGDQLPPHLSIPVDKGVKHWSAEQENQFYARLWKHYPASEHVFMLVADDTSLIEPTIADHITLRLAFNMLSRLSVDKKPMRMIPSRGMTQALVEATTPDPLNALYRLDVPSTLSMRAAMKTNGYNLYQSFAPLQHLSVTQIDQFPVKPAYAEAEFKCFFYQVFTSHIPLAHRKCLAAFADAVQATIDYYGKECLIEEKFITYLIDNDHSYYFMAQSPPEYQALARKDHRQKQLPKEILFWMNVGSAYSQALDDFQFLSDTQNPYFIELIAAWLIQHHEQFTSFCRPIADLLISDQEMPLVDYRFNFYYDLREKVQNQIKESTLNQIKEDCEELTQFKAYFRTAPDTFVRTFQYELTKSSL